MPLNFENQLCLGCAAQSGVVDLILASLVAQNLFHLILGNESSVVSKSILSQIFSAMVPDVVFVSPLLFLFPVSQDFVSTLLCGKRGPADS